MQEMAGDEGEEPEEVSENTDADEVDMTKSANIRRLFLARRLSSYRQVLSLYVILRQA